MEIIQFGRKSADFLGHLMLGHQISESFVGYGNIFSKGGGGGFFFSGFEDQELLAKAKLEFKHVWPGVVVDEQHTAPTSSTRQTSLHVSVPAGVRRFPKLLLGNPTVKNDDLTKL